MFLAILPRLELHNPVQLLDLSSRIVDVHGIVLEVPVDRCDSSTNILEP